MVVRKDLRPSDLVVAKVASGSKILKILVVSENLSWLGREFQVVLPMFESSNDGQELLVIDLIVHFSREEDYYTGLHDGLDKMDAVIIIKQLMKDFKFNEFDIKVLCNGVD